MAPMPTPSRTRGSSDLHRRLQSPLRQSAAWLRATTPCGSARGGCRLRGPRSYAGLTVDVRELLDGRLVVLHDGDRADIFIDLRQRDLPIAFVPQRLTSYGGLEVLRPPTALSIPLPSASPGGCYPACEAPQYFGYAIDIY